MFHFQVIRLALGRYASADRCFNSLFEMHEDIVERRIKNVYQFWFQFSI